MKVARWYNNQDIRIEEVPTPTPGSDEMLVKVISCGICGSDIVEWYRLPRAPLVPGHEIGAEVVEVGQALRKFSPGDRVFIAPKVPCMQCDYCKNEHYPACTNIKERLPGGFAEYVLVPDTLIENGAYRLPDSTSYDQSTFIEPLACVVRAQRLAGVQPGQDVMVLGCGMSGLLHVKLAKAKNCKVIATDVNARRLELAAGLDADITIDATENVAEEKQVTVPLNEFWTKEIQILTSYYCGPPDIVDAIDLIESGTVSVDDLITHKLPLNKITEGFQLVLDGKESIKVIIKPNQ
jgi:L-iditol 2-dehydrogenase